MTKEEALKLALEALENLEHSNFKRRRLDALIAIKQVLAQTIADEHFAKFDSDINLAVNKAMAQPESDPWRGGLAQPEQARNFCPRCGKRTADLTTIHTCTPPRENT